MLSDAGVEHCVVPAGVDEDALKAGLSGPDAIVEALAKAKASEVGGRNLNQWVIGSDSVVSVGNRIFAKPRDQAEAARHLRFFSTRAMVLTSAVALVNRGIVDWSFVDSATLQVRELSDTFIESYLDAEWPRVGQCVGVFRMEGPGAQLFERVEGSHFTILGMPLIPLLGALRERGLLMA